MAEFVLKDMVKKAGVAGNFHIASCAASREELGNPVYPPARRELARHGIKCEKRGARQITRSDYAYYDLLLGMDSANIRNMRRMLGGDPDGKIRLLLDYTGRARDISDPWYSGNFDATYSDVVEGCTALLRELGY